MFTFEKWRGWLLDRADALRAENFNSEVKSSDNPHKPNTVLTAQDKRFVGQFSSWITGEADIDVWDLESGSTQPVFHRWGLKLDDETYEGAFQEFVDALVKLRNSN